MALRETPPAARVRYAMVGVGAQATEQLLPALGQLAGATLVAVAARHEDRARDAAVRWGAGRYTDDWADLLSCDDVDALVVAADAGLHAEVAEACLRAGRPVYVEKPPAPGTSELERLARLEERTSSVAFVGMNFPYGESYARLLERVRRGGPVRSVQVRLASAKPRAAAAWLEDVDATILQDLGLHAVDLAIRALGPPDDVSAERATIDETRRVWRIALRYDDGRLAVLDVGNWSNRLEYDCELIAADGTTGRLEQHNTLTVAGGARRPELDGKEVVRYVWPSRRGGYGRTGYLPALERFHRAVLGETPSDSPLAALLPAYEVLDRVREHGLVRR